MGFSEIQEIGLSGAARGRLGAGILEKQSMSIFEYPCNNA
jgi:hypothetical protein